MANADDMIFLLSDDRVLQRVPVAQYESEDLLQRLIESYPELLVGDQIDQDAPPQWLLVAREAGIPDTTDGSSRWSIDHLLLDQYGRPTFVEVKRSSDTRIRREVVGQMLDYAANGIVHWPADRLRALATEQYGGSDRLGEALGELIGLETSEDEDAWQREIELYWATVEKNLKEGNVRLLFVADAIPRELRRIIEFLNEKMSSVDVLGVEIRQYRGEGISALVPRVFGSTESARDAKGVTARSPRRASGPISRDAFLATHSGAVREFLERLIERAESDPLFLVTWRTTSPSIRINDPKSGKALSIIYAMPAQSGPQQLQVYLEYVNRDYPEVVANLRRSLEALGMISSGKWLMNMDLSPATLEQAEMVVEEIWRVPHILAQKLNGDNQGDGRQGAKSDPGEPASAADRGQSSS